MNKIQSAVITPILAAGSVASPYNFLINITQRLCYPACADGVPVFAPQFTMLGVTQVGPTLYNVTVRVQGIISYVQCNGECGCTKQQPLNQEFTIPVQSATVPTVTIDSGTTFNSIDAVDCQKCSRAFVSETPLTVTVA